MPKCRIKLTFHNSSLRLCLELHERSLRWSGFTSEERFEDLDADLVHFYLKGIQIFVQAEGDDFFDGRVREFGAELTKQTFRIVRVSADRCAGNRVKRFASCNETVVNCPWKKAVQKEVIHQIGRAS